MSTNTDFYGYLPSKSAGLFGVSFFATCTITCLFQILFGRYKHYWMLILATASLGEAVGWGARLWAHFAPTDWMPYMIQICSLLVSPALISATAYIMFCRIVDKTISRLFYMPSWFYWAGFIVCDIVSLSIQTVGGVEVSSALNYLDLNHGVRVILAGVIFQFSNTAIFVVLLLATNLRLRKKGPTMASTAGWPAMVVMSVSTLMLLIRNGYRIFELSAGWHGRLLRTQGYLIGLDMVPMAVAVAAFVVFSPCFFFQPGKCEPRRAVDNRA